MVSLLMKMEKTKDGLLSPKDCITNREPNHSTNPRETLHPKKALLKHRTLNDYSNSDSDSSSSLKNGNVVMHVVIEMIAM